MELAAEGFSAHVFRNQVRSVLLLAGLPVLLLFMLAAFFGGLDILTQKGLAAYAPTDWGRAYNAAVAGLTNYGHWAFLGSGAWFVIAYFFHGRMMRMATGAMPVTRQQMPRIYNMLENLCISRGIPMPQFEVIDSPALNAFASGINDKTYKIVLTRGIIDRLEDDELEGVIAHELSHILNRDVRLMIIAVIFVGMIGFFAEFLFRSMTSGRRGAYVRRDNSKQTSATLFITLLALAILIIGYVFALLIRFALSRRREYLADAGAVSLTKNPEAMMRALLRISGQDKVAGMPDEVQQMCIENSAAFMGIFATHPPIDSRVMAISRTTGAPVPELAVSLKRGPRRPWDNGPAEN